MSNYIGIIIGIIGLILSCYFYVKSKKKKIPVFLKNTISIVESNKVLPDLELVYKNIKIPNIAVSKLAFFNRGDDVIDASDVSSIEPLKIIFPQGTTILDSTIDYFTKKANGFTLCVSENNIILVFDFVGKGNGVVINVIHTVSENFFLEIAGTIKGVDKIENIKAKRGWRILNFFLWLSVALLGIISGIGIAFIFVVSTGKVSLEWYKLLFIPLGYLLSSFALFSALGFIGKYIEKKEYTFTDFYWDKITTSDKYTQKDKG